MKALILAAGYATRLKELTLNKPKGLLPINGKPIINYICSELEAIDAIDEIYIVSNNKFYNDFCTWKKEWDFEKKITIINDGSTNDDNKLGAIGDIFFSIKEMSINDDLLIIASDNFFTYKLLDFYNFYLTKKSYCICVSQVDNIADLQRMAVIKLDSTDKIVHFTEKPRIPYSNLVAYASYIYTKETLPLFGKYLEEGNSPDSPGYFASWLYTRKDIYGYKFEGKCYDIGVIDTYNLVNSFFKK